MYKIVVVVVGVLCGVAVWQREAITEKAKDITGKVKALISQDDVSVGVAVESAEMNLRRLISAQNSYVHRQMKNRRLARSIDELGNGIKGNGCVIYSDIWYSRSGGDKQLLNLDAELQEQVRSHPYSYSIMPLRDVYGGRDDELSCLAVAIPKTDGLLPMLVLSVGPIKSDPVDFHKKWPVFKILEKETMDLVKSAVDANSPCDKELLSKIHNSK